MVRDPLDRESGPELEPVLAALHDDDCRTIIELLDEPRTANELLERSDISQSTLYRKLDRLTDATLLAEGTEIRDDGSHAGLYDVDFREVVVVCDEEDRSLSLEIERPPQRADERLAELWTEVRKEL